VLGMMPGLLYWRQVGGENTHRSASSPVNGAELVCGQIASGFRRASPRRRRAKHPV